ncbi:protein FAR1-RELATED SEQUENCE 5-like [Corylus avellana]|uniref:protein FAR1-RELATED SEQUENCE 5-like n=1 Tax=Corylus avellana TaxID=13451 RepID=UPI00286CA02E|nr:protein FAR1-RELATED SEQUENCE 5-like [Corylus avellana]
MDSENECEDDKLRTHIRVGDDLPSEIVLENDGNETIRDEDNNNGKGKGKSEWKLLGGYENLPFIEKDCRNFINKERHIRLSQGGAKALLDYLNKMQATDSGFYFAVDSDDDSRLKNVFWIDARSRVSYESFGDVVTFDTTYLPNKYGLPFPPFVGVNHHSQSILFGTTLISSEDTENFVGCQSLLDSYDLKDHDWLRRLYNERTFWVPAYLKGVFWAGMRTTQRSESMNAFFDGYVRPSTTLKQFVDQYDVALRKKVENESLADFKSFNTKLPCVKVQNEVVEDAYLKVVTYVVYFNEDEDEFEVKCTCDFFDSRGIFFDALSANPEVQRYDSLCKGMHTLAKIAARNVDHYTKVRTHIDMLTKELRASSCEPSPPSLALLGVSLTCNESIDDVELAVDGDEVQQAPSIVGEHGLFCNIRWG